MFELRKDSLSFLETLGQSVANVSPTLTPALAVAVVAGMAGTASWLVYIAATVALLIVGVNVGKLAKRIPCAGSFFIYVSRSLGPAYGLLAGWGDACGLSFHCDGAHGGDVDLRQDAVHRAQNQFRPEQPGHLRGRLGARAVSRRARYAIFVACQPYARGDLGGHHPFWSACSRCPAPASRSIPSNSASRASTLERRSRPSSSRSSPTSGSRARRRSARRLAIPVASSRARFR